MSNFKQTGIICFIIAAVAFIYSVPGCVDTLKQGSNSLLIAVLFTLFGFVSLNLDEKGN